MDTLFTARIHDPWDDNRQLLPTPLSGITSDACAIALEGDVELFDRLIRARAGGQLTIVLQLHIAIEQFDLLRHFGTESMPTEETRIDSLTRLLSI
jgi:hypothetical protein